MFSDECNHVVRIKIFAAFVQKLAILGKKNGCYETQVLNNATGYMTILLTLCNVLWRVYQT